MAYRNGTYVAFHANGETDPTKSDMRYYNLLKAWDANNKFELTFANSHDKTYSVRDSSKKETLMRSLKERLNNSKNMVLIIGDTTRSDDDWVIFEIEYAIDKCEIPIIATYPNINKRIIHVRSQCEHLWPKALKCRIDNQSARVIHIPFMKWPITSAILKYDLQNLPPNGLSHWSGQDYDRWGIP